MDANRFRSAVVLGAAFAAAMVACPVVAQSDEPAPSAHVRGHKVGTCDAETLLEGALTGSPTVRRLVAALDASNVYVIVELRDRIVNRSGYLTFIGAAHQVRWLKVTIELGVNHVERGAWLAHELQHAVEIASAPEVQSTESLRRYYARIGHEWSEGHFETDAPIEAGNQALRELSDRAGPRADTNQRALRASARVR
jgi:hypothetical protein